MKIVNINYENSFAYYIECILGENLYDIWNFEKNNKLGLDPYKLSMKSNKKVWLFCLKHKYHNYDRQGNKVGYEMSCSDFVRPRRCPYCSHNKTHWMDSLAYKKPRIAKMISIQKNKITFEDCYNIACGSTRKFYVECDECGNISSKKISLDVLNRLGFSCEYCNRFGNSIPERFFSNILLQLKEQNQIDDFKNHVRSNILEWLGDYEYDFYVIKNNETFIFETHGKQHYENGTGWATNKLDLQRYKDTIKRRKAKFYGIDNYIEIDCRHSTFEWLKENIIKELLPYFSLSNINWELAWKESLGSLVVKVCEIWNNGNHNIEYISELLDISQPTVRKYLKRGSEIDICDYNPKENLSNGGNKRKCENNHRSKLYWVIKSDGKPYSDKPLCELEIYCHHSKGILSISRQSFHKYIKPYGNIDINRITSKSYKAQQTKEKLTPFNGWQFIPLSKEEKEEYLNSLDII